MKRPGLAAKTLKYIFSVLLAIIMLIPIAMSPAAVSAVSDTPYFRTLTVNTGQVPSTQTDFPMLVSLSGNYLKTVANAGHVANADGSDIYFTDAAGTTQYPFEIEQYDGTAGTLAAWVKVPSVADGTVIKMYYGGSPAVANNPADVWDADYKGVWHMNQTSPADSTSNANNGAAQGTGTLTALSGKIDGAVNFPGNSDPAYISCGNAASMQFTASGAYTWSVWVNPPASQSGGSGILEKKTAGADSTGQGYVINIGGGSPSVRFQSTSDSTYQLASYNLANFGVWTLVTVTYNNGATNIYINGELDAYSPGNVPSTDDTVNDFLIGRRSAKTAEGFFYGMIDEVEYSSGVRSAEWILTQYRNQNNPAAFYAIGDEEGGPPEGTAPEITLQPLNQTVTEGQDASFTAAASGIPEPTVLWQVSTDGGTNWDDIDDATETTLDVIGTTLDQNGYQYRAVFTNTVDSAITDAAVLTVNPPSSDVTPPTWGYKEGPVSIDTHVVPYTSVWMTWRGAEDDVAVTQFRVYMKRSDTGETTITTVPAGEYEFIGSIWQGEYGLTLPTHNTDTTYYFKVQAGDAAGNWSEDFNYFGDDAQYAPDGRGVSDGPSVLPTPPSWPDGAYLRAYRTGTPEDPEVLFAWSQPTDGANGGEVYGYTFKLGTTTPPANFVDSLSDDDYFRLDEFRDYVNRTYLWTADNPHLNVAPGSYTGESALFPLPEPDKDYYAAMRAYAWGDTLDALGPVVHFNTGWSNSPLAFSNIAKLMNMAYPSSELVYAQTTKPGNLQTYYSLVNEPLDPQNAFFRLASYNGGGYQTIAADGSLSTDYIQLVKKDTGEIITLPSDPDGLTAYNQWLTNPPSWTIDNGTYYGYKIDSADANGDTAYLDIHLPTLEPNTTYVLTLKSLFTANFNGADYSWEFTTAAPPVVTLDPASQVVTEGADAVFTAAATGSPTPDVQWEVSTDGGSTWDILGGEVDTTLTVGSVTLGQSSYQYRAVFTNNSGTATTASATLTVSAAMAAPNVVTQPIDQTVTVGDRAIFAAAATGNPYPDIQWQVSTDGGSTWKNLFFDTNPAIYLFDVALSQNGYQYRAVYTNSEGTATSNAATLIVNAAAPADTTPPYWVTEDYANSVDTSTIPYTVHLSWSGAADDVGVTQYRVYANNAVIATVTDTSLDYVLPTFATDSRYYFRVNAGDAAGNWDLSGNTMGHEHTGPMVTRGYSVYNGNAGGTATAPEWGTEGWLRAYNAGTASGPEVLLRWSQPEGGDYDGLTWGYTVKASKTVTPPDKFIDSVNMGDDDSFRFYPGRTYLWSDDNSNINMQSGSYGEGAVFPVPEANTNYYFTMMARNWADSLHSTSPIVRFNTSWNPTMYAESSGRYTYMSYPASAASYVEASGDGKHTIYNIVTNPVDPENAWFQLWRTAGTNPNWVVAAGAVDPHFVLTDKETGEVVPLTGNLVATPAKYNGWPVSYGGSPWTPDKGTFYGWKNPSTGGIYIECHVSYTGSTPLLSGHTYVLSIVGSWDSLYFPANYIYSWEFTTVQADKVAPTWPDGAALTADAVTPTTVTMSWPAADDNIGVTAYKVYRDGSLVATLDAAVTDYTDTGLTPGATYNWTVTALDYLVNVSVPLALGPIDTPIDTAAPIWPGGSTLTALNIEAASLDLEWTPATDDYPVTGYQIYKGDELIATVAGDVLTYHVTGLDPVQPYLFTVQAGDESGNWSTDGPSVSTGTGEDTMAPTWPDGSIPTVTGVTPTSISLSWPAAADNHKVDHYEILVNGSLAVTIAAPTTTATVTDLVPASDCAIQIVAFDPSGNSSPGTLINQWVPSQEPTYGSGIPFYLISPSKNISTTESDSVNIITCLVPADELHLRFLFSKEMDLASLQSGITLNDETAAQAIDLSGSAFILTPAGAAETLDFATTGYALQAGHTYAIRLASSISATDATLLGKDFVWRFTAPDLPDRIVAFSRGTAAHEVMLLSDGTVWSWGDNSNGQFGDGTTTGSNVPVQANGLDHVIAIAADSGYTLVLRDDGTVWGMGRGNSLPYQIAGIDGVQSITANSGNMLALRYDGTVWGWGGNRNGALGVGIGSSAAGETIPVAVPTQCPGLTQVTAIAVSEQNAYALRLDETVWAAGNNAWGQLGSTVCLHPTGPNPQLNRQTAFFQPVPGLRRIVSISAQRTHAITSDRDGSVWYWGNIPSPWPAEATLAPVMVPDVSDAKAVSAGMPCDLVLCNDGSVRIVHWMCEYSSEGHGSYGPYGEFTFAPSVTLSIGDVVLIDGGWFIGHAVTSDNNLYEFDTSTGAYEIPFHMPDGVAYLEPALLPHVSVNAPVAVAINSDFTAGIDVNTIDNFNVADYTITFDPAVLQLDDITDGNIGGTTVPVYFNQNPAGTVKVVNDLNMPATGVSGSGNLAVLHFHVIGDIGQSSPISISDGTLASNTATEIQAVWESITVNITPIPASVTLSCLTQTYDGTPKAAMVTIDPAGLAYTITYDGSADVPVNAGSYAVVVTVTEPDYSGSATGTLVINKADQTITFDQIEDKGYASPDFDITAAASSGLPVTFTASGPCTVTGNTVHITGTGTCTITASQAGDTNYNAATDVPRSFEVLVISGDANGDGKINAVDITKTIRIVLGLDPVTDTADANGDGKINALDIAQIELIILNSH